MKAETKTLGHDGASIDPDDLELMAAASKSVHRKVKRAEKVAKGVRRAKALNEARGWLALLILGFCALATAGLALHFFAWFVWQALYPLRWGWGLWPL